MVNSDFDSALLKQWQCVTQTVTVVNSDSDSG